MSGDVRFFGLLEQQTSYFFLWRLSSKKKASMGFSLEDKSFTGLSSLTKTKIPPPFWFQSSLKGDA